MSEEYKTTIVNGDTVTEPIVLMSNAGHYIGRLYHEKEFDTWLPYDRLSGYYKSRSLAEKDLVFYRE